jgi:hypothetical protein
MLSAWKAEDFLYTLFSVMPNSRYLRSSALGAGACILDIAGISRHRSVNGACSCYESSPSGTQVLYHPDLLDKYLQVHGIDTTASFERHASILQHAHRDSPSTSDPESCTRAIREQVFPKQSFPDFQQTHSILLTFVSVLIPALSK